MLPKSIQDDPGLSHLRYKAQRNSNGNNSNSNKCTIDLYLSHVQGLEHGWSMLRGCDMWGRWYCAGSFEAA